MNKYHRNRHLAIRNIQRTDPFGKMSYREARRKYKSGYRAVPVGSGHSHRWFLLNFGTDKFTLAQSRKLGEEYTTISEHAESAQFKATMRYDVKMHCLGFKYRGLNSVWRLALTIEEVKLLIGDGRLAVCVMRSAESEISDLRTSNNIGIRYPFAGISYYTRSEDFNEIVAHGVRDWMQGVSSVAYRSVPLPVFAGYGITRIDK